MWGVWWPCRGSGELEGAQGSGRHTIPGSSGHGKGVFIVAEFTTGARLYPLPFMGCLTGSVPLFRYLENE